MPRSAKYGAMTALERLGNRLTTLPYRWDAAIGRLMASTPLTIRIDLVG